MSLHYTASAVTAFHLNRLSDHIGRKPVLLTSVAGAAISVILFGLSHSFGAILFRCLPQAIHPFPELRDVLTVFLFVTVAVFMAH